MVGREFVFGILFVMQFFLSAGVTRHNGEYAGRFVMVRTSRVFMEKSGFNCFPETAKGASLACVSWKKIGTRLIMPITRPGLLARRSLHSGHHSCVSDLSVCPPVGSPAVHRRRPGNTSPPFSLSEPSTHSQTQTARTETYIQTCAHYR